jgi:hypothetical protein
LRIHGGNTNQRACSLVLDDVTDTLVRKWFGKNSVTAASTYKGSIYRHPKPDTLAERLLRDVSGVYGRTFLQSEDTVVIRGQKMPFASATQSSEASTAGVPFTLNASLSILVAS